MLQGTYVGDNPELLGKTALLREDPITNCGGNFGMLLAQFDDLENLPLHLTHGWTLYERKDWDIGPPTDFEEPQ